MKKSPKTNRKPGIKRDLFAELKEGMDALADNRHGKRALRTHSVESTAAPIVPKMSKPRKEKMTVRVLRNGEPEPPDRDWSKATMEERIEGVWMLTRRCMEWNNPSSSEPEFQKTVTRLIRKQR